MTALIINTMTALVVLITVLIILFNLDTIINSFFPPKKQPKPLDIDNYMNSLFDLLSKHRSALEEHNSTCGEKDCTELLKEKNKN